jgi:hypothetical protein
VNAMIILAGIAATVAIKTRHRTFAAGFQFFTKNIFTHLL